MKTYIHYGSKQFDKERFVPILNRYPRNKPIGGLWASEVDAPISWRNWCEQNEFYPERNTEDNCFRFNLADNAKILTLRCVNDVKLLPQLSNERFGHYFPDFQEIIKQGYDVIDYRLSDDTGANCNLYHGDLYYALYGWDCDSILVLNPDVIIPIKA